MRAAERSSLSASTLPISSTIVRALRLGPFSWRGARDVRVVDVAWHVAVTMSSAGAVPAMARTASASTETPTKNRSREFESQQSATSAGCL